MESLTPEGKAIYDTITAATAAAAATQQEQQRKDLGVLITNAVNAAMESIVSVRIDNAIANMTAYADGVESSLQQHLTVLREQVGLAAHTDDPDLTTRTTGGRRGDRPRWAPRSTDYTEAGGRGFWPLHPASGKRYPTHPTHHCASFI